MKKGPSVQTVLIFYSSENVDAHASVAPCTALLICVHIEVYSAGNSLCKSAGIGRYAVAVDELAIKRDDIKLGSVRELLGVDFENLDTCLELKLEFMIRSYRGRK